jgi:hypothetical protein
MRSTVIAAVLTLAALPLRGESPNQAVPLFNDAPLAEWELISPEPAKIEATCAINSAGVLTVTGKPTGYLQTTRAYRNFRLDLEWRWNGKAGNSGVLVHISSGPIDRNLWPRCVQVQLKHEHAGDLLPMAGAQFAEPLSPTPPGSAVQLNHSEPHNEHALGEWNRCEIVCDEGAIRVTINGVLQNQATGCVPAEGRIGLQLEGAAYEIRHATIQEL